MLKDVTYGAVSAYMAVVPGQYTVAMRGFGASATSKPALTTSFMVTAGAAYTLAALGPDPGLRTEVLKDQMTAPAGKAVVRVLQASLKQHRVTVSYGPDVLARQLAFGAATSYKAVSPGVQTVRFAAPGEHATMPVTMAADSVHTIVVLDDSSGLKVDAVTDAVGQPDHAGGRRLRRIRRHRTTPAGEPRAMAGDDRGRGPAHRGGSCPVAPPRVTRLCPRLTGLGAQPPPGAPTRPRRARSRGPRAGRLPVRRRRR